MRALLVTTERHASTSTSILTFVTASVDTSGWGATKVSMVVENRYLLI